MSNKDILADKLDFTYKKEENLSDVRNFISICASYWYLFAISIGICLIAAFIYISINKSHLNKPALFISMGLYLVYTFVEVSVLMKLLRGNSLFLKHKHG